MFVYYNRSQTAEKDNQNEKNYQAGRHYRVKHKWRQIRLTHLSLIWTSSGYCVILYMITKLSLLHPEVQKIKFPYDWRGYLWLLVKSLVRPEKEAFKPASNDRQWLDLTSYYNIIHADLKK